MMTVKVKIVGTLQKNYWREFENVLSITNKRGYIVIESGHGVYEVITKFIKKIKVFIEE